MDENIYFKQKNLFNPHEQQVKCFVYGAGSIGSHVAVGLAKIGVKEITVYDFDVVETGNFPAQFFDTSSKGLKVDELKRLVWQMTGTEIETDKTKIEKGFKPSLEFGSAHFICFDNIQARKIIFEALKGFPVHMFDGRIGGFNYESYYIDCQNKNQCSKYSATLEGGFAEEECGGKCLWAVNSLLSGMMVGNLVRLVHRRAIGGKVIGTLMGDDKIIARWD